MNLRRRSFASLLSVGLCSLLAAACSAEAGDIGDVEGDFTPDNRATAPISSFEQAATCDSLFKDRAASRDADLAEGVLRWKCGDVAGVTMSKCEDKLELLRQAEEQGQNGADRKRDDTLGLCEDGLGQEYCEYNAMARGEIVNSPSAASKVGLKDSDVVECLFNGVYSDVTEETSSHYREMLGKTMVSSNALRGLSADTTLEPRASGMRQGVNSRGAADTLLADCAHLATQTSHKDGDGKIVDHKAKWADAQRQTACYRMWAETQAKGNKALADKLATACGGAIVTVKADSGKLVKHRPGADLSQPEAWAKAAQLGVRVDEKNDADRDVSSCIMVRYAENGGVSWRNSDPTICARSFRAADECGYTGFASIPAGGELDSPAPSDLRFDGFEMRGWTNRDTLPQGCKYALKKANGSDYTRLVVCTPLASDVKSYRTQKKPLQELCRDKFGANVAMQAPVGLLAQGPGREDTPFCKAFAAGVHKIQGK